MFCLCDKSSLLDISKILMSRARLDAEQQIENTIYNKKCLKEEN